MKTKSVIIAPDDLQIGDLITVHSIKNTKRTVPLMGLALKIKAINLPYIAVHSDLATCHPLDVRYLNIMRISKEFADAQTPKEIPQQNIFANLFGMPVQQQPPPEQPPEDKSNV